MYELNKQSQKCLLEVQYFPEVEKVKGEIEPLIKSSFFDNKDSKIEHLAEILDKNMQKLDLGENFKIKNAEFVTHKDEYFVVVVGIVRDSHKMRNTAIKIA